MAQIVAAHHHRRFDVRLFVIGGVVLAAVLFIVASLLGDLGVATVDTTTGRNFACTVLSTEDGDGPIYCAERDQEGLPVVIRLRGIEARDSDGGCRIASGCTEMTPDEAAWVLRRIITGQRLQCVSYGRSYERIDAFCTTPEGVDVSCEMIRMAAAVRWAEFDTEGRLAQCVPGRRR